MGSFLFADKKGVHVRLCFLPLLQDLTQTATYSWGGAVIAHTYRELCRASLDRRRSISGYITLLQVGLCTGPGEPELNRKTEPKISTTEYIR